MAVETMNAQQLLDFGLRISEDEDLSFEKAKEYMNAAEKDINTQPAEDLMNQVKAGFAYWKKKFDRLESCKNKEAVAKLFEEFMFTDPDREKWNKNGLNFIQIAMKMFINTARNKLFDFPRYYDTPRKAIEESLGLRNKFTVMSEMMDKICIKHGYKSTEDYMKMLGV